MKINCEISTEELLQLLEENEKNHRVLTALLKNAGVELEAQSASDRDADEAVKVNQKTPAFPGKLNPYTLQKWKAAAEILEEEISDYAENEEELESIKYLCRTKEEYEDLEKEVQISGKLVNALQEVLRLLEERDRMRAE